MLRKPGFSVKLSCRTLGYTSTELGEAEAWSGMEWIGRIYPRNGSTNYAQKFQSKATLSADKSSSTTYMKFRSLISEDSSVYYYA